MSDHAIRICGLDKVFRVWRQPRDLLIEAISGRRRHTDFQALTNINLEVSRGTVVGIMGRNGAGKSTLLRIVAGTLDATAGTVAVVGKVSAILELGTGFHPDYTGRENVFLGGLCLGLNRKQIAGRFDEIVDFSELAEVIDRPFRTYSSGMQARLTFAVATSVEADLLIIDEALAVGDARFQLKSFDRVRGFRRQGKSILLVSHDINQIVSVCDRAILLEGGRVIADGDPGRVGNQYHELLFGPRTQLAAEAPDPSRVVAAPAWSAPADAPTRGLAKPTASAPAATRSDPVPVEATVATETQANPAPMEATMLSGERAAAAVIAEAAGAGTPAPKREHRYGDGRARIVDVRLLDQVRRPVTSLRSLERYHLVCRIEALDALDNLCLGFLVRDRRGLDLFGWDMLTAGHGPLPAFREREQRDVEVNFCANMAAGEYFMTVALARWHDGHKYDVRFDSHVFRVEATPQLFTASVLNLDPRLDVRIDTGASG
jgi:lipopolysaccharide transport system ATP-binding protein